MIEFFDFTNNNGLTWHFNTDTCPLKEFEVDVDIRTEEVPRMQEHGLWPSYSYAGKMLLHLTGDILQATPQAYIADRIQMLKVLTPAGVVVTHRTIGKITMQYTGQETMYNDSVTLDAAPSIPMHALYPSVTEFQITFKCFKPYMIGAGSGQFYSI
jgi:hypothetical protein